MNFFQRRQLRKGAKHLLHEARHARHLRGDITDPLFISELRDAERGVRDAWRGGEADAVEASLKTLSEAIEKVLPPRPNAKLRENIEIITVAIAVAMGFRTYFLQPFKIPTGSMQPTLYGITYHPQPKRSALDLPPLNAIKFLTTGEWYKEYKAKTDGYVEGPFPTQDRDTYAVNIVTGAKSKIAQLIPRAMSFHVSSGQLVKAGDVLASGNKKLGDHIFVDKVRYNFTRPERGDIVVFNTDRIDHPRIKKHTFYIKRMAGAPGDTVTVDPPDLRVNGDAVEEPYPFNEAIHGSPDGFYGYNYANRFVEGHRSALATDSDSVTLGAMEFLPLGDNTLYSLDGRYFGPVQLKSMVGPAVAVYWPFTKRWGRVR